MSKHTVPFFNLSKQTEMIKPKLLERITNIIDTQQFIGGSIITDFEAKLANTVDAQHAVACNSGTDALWLALKALNLKANNIVLSTPFSFIASSSEIVAHGAHPAFVDIDPKTFTICPDKLEQWLTHETTQHDNQTIHNTTQMPVVGIVTVDLFGHCADYKRIKQIADKWNLWIVEDACQAIGAQLHEPYQGNKKAGTLGDIATFSFYPTKNVGSIGDAGACTTNNPELAARLTRLRNHGRASHYNYEELGINSRMDTIQAVALSTKLDYLPDFTRTRQHHANTYKTLLSHVANLTLPTSIWSTHVYHQYAVRVKDEQTRNELMAYLQDHGVGTRIFYPELLCDIPFIQTNKKLVSSYPVALNAVKTSVCLPVWPELTDYDISYVAEQLQNFMRSKADSLSAVPTQSAL